MKIGFCGTMSVGKTTLVNYDNLSLVDYSNIHFVGDALSARGITVSGAQGIYVAESIIKGQEKEYDDYFEHSLFI